ncbi:MAG TPA: pyruvate kinase, partial [Acidimicrobiales bacterium]|nr:pyruvate kinase [Acidimicrobiales bacterium]
MTEAEPETNIAEDDQSRLAQDLSSPAPSPALEGHSRPGRRCVGPAPRRTRVVATIGPASDDPATLTAMQDAGMDVARLPLAHGSLQDAVDRLRRVRQAAPEVGVLVDLPGPKIRTTPFPDGGVNLVTGRQVVLSPAGLAPRSTAETIGVSLPE